MFTIPATEFVSWVLCKCIDTLVHSKTITIECWYVKGSVAQRCSLNWTLPMGQYMNWPMPLEMRDRRWHRPCYQHTAIISVCMTGRKMVQWETFQYQSARQCEMSLVFQHHHRLHLVIHCHQFLSNLMFTLYKYITHTISIMHRMT